MSNLTTASSQSLPAQARRNSAIIGQLNVQAFAAPELELSLPDGRSVTAKLQRVDRDDARAARSWVGEIEGAPGSLVVLSQVRGSISGIIDDGNDTYEVRPTAGGMHLLFAVDTARLPQGDGVLRSGVSAPDALATNDIAGGYTGASAATAATATTPVVQDILIVYTAKAANAWGKSTLESMIRNGVQAAIQAYQSSNIYVTLNVVGLQQVALSESSSGMQSTLNSLIQNPTIRSLRNTLAADMVVLVSEDSGYCGWSSVMVANGNTDAYSVVKDSCISQHSLAHEVGHLQGLDHNRENGGNGGFYPYGYGYRVCVTGGWRDVMSYSCPGVSVPRVLRFSNPNLYYNGYVTGISYESSPSTAADAARASNNSATLVASWRAGTTTTTPPAAPSSLATSSIAYNAVGLTWADNSGNETGFQLQRSTDGVNFSLIATLGANARTYSDVAVAASSTYYYRVRAYNGSGSSAFSNVLKVGTPAASTPPAAPSSLAASSIAYNAVGLAWADNSGNEAGFQLQRSTDGVNFSLIATLGSNARTYSDVAVAASSTYYYRVRAYNSSGSSAFSNVLKVGTPAATTSPAPAAPSSLAASSIAYNAVGLAWADNSGNETGFQLQRSTDGVNFSLIATLGANVRTYLDVTLAASTTYYYRVRAYNSSGSSGFSNLLKVATTSRTP